jgi:acetyl esterase/lipase
MEGLKVAGWLLGVLLSQLANATTIQYPPAAAGASFDAVQDLPAGEPQAVHRYGEAESQFAELWLPAGGDPAPVLVFIHGGCWLNQYDIGHSRALATALSQSGYAVWNIEYRRVGDVGGGWPGSLQDIRAALALLQSLGAPRLDLQRLALAGHSAGGHLALLAATSLPGSLEAQAVLGLAPITDIAAYARGEGSCNRAALDFLGPGGPVAAANPASQAAPAGTVILLGRQDRIVPYQVPALEPHTLVGVEAGHFDWIHPGTPAWNRFLLELGRALP